MEKGEVREVAKEAAKEAVKETFSLLGVDITEQDEINDFRADLVFARKQRRMSEAVKSRVVMMVVLGVTIGTIVTFSDWIKAFLHMGKGPG